MEHQLRKDHFYAEFCFVLFSPHSKLTSVNNSYSQTFPFILHFLGALKGRKTSKISK